MSALPIRELVPMRAGVERWLAVLICYLDDSGKDKENRAETLAGFVAKAANWDSFERAAEPIFVENKVPVFHAMDMHHTRGVFDGWTRQRKQDFVDELCVPLRQFIPFGVTISAVKGAYAKRAKEAPKRHRVFSSYAFCFNVIVDWILRDARVGQAVREEGLSFILETGHDNNPDAERCFHDIRRTFDLAGILRSISFVGKEECRAIQMADLIAFYSRRRANQMERVPAKDREALEPEAILKAIAQTVRIRNFVAVDFGPASLALAANSAE